MNLLGNPVETLASALHAALLRDLPPIVVREKDWDAFKRLPFQEQRARKKRDRAGDRAMGIPTITKKRRPYQSEVVVEMFSQVWPTRALGFEWPGEEDLTTAYTVIVEHNGVFAVYFGGRFAYLVMEVLPSGADNSEGMKAFSRDVVSKSMATCADAVRRYQAIRMRTDASGKSADGEE